MRAKFIYETIKHLSPKSEDEIEKSLLNLSPDELLIEASKLGLTKIVKKALDKGADAHI